MFKLKVFAQIVMSVTLIFGAPMKWAGAQILASQT